MQNPIDVFRQLWLDARRRGELPHRNAVCLSTIDDEGFPSSRFVDLKEVADTGFVFCTSLESPKALEIGRDPRAGLTLWWAHVATQVRIRGRGERLTPREAEVHWDSRPRAAQLATLAFRQSHPLDDPGTLARTLSQAAAAFENRSVPRPEHWGGFRIRPQRIEFLEFRADRRHARTVYDLTAGQWQKRFLQP